LGIVALALLSLPVSAQPAGAPCGGWLSVQALVVRIDPAATKPKILGLKQANREAAVDGALCSGETLVVPSGVTVVLYEAGQNRAIGGGGADSRYTVGGKTRFLEQAANYVVEALKTVGAVRAPNLNPAPTRSRGAGDPPGAPVKEEPLRPVAGLRDLPRQALTLDARPRLGWRGGVSTYHCEALKEDGSLKWTGQFLFGSTCPVTALDEVARVVVRDARGASVGWNVAKAAWADVPRPAWVATGNPKLGSSERMAWAIWLWREADAKWRLQALSMLESAKEQWLAGYFVDSLFDEMSLVAPAATVTKASP
jgi:hypothetical protein